MNRREALKIAALSTLAVTAASAYDSKLVVNKEKMSIKDPKNPTKAELKHTPEMTLHGKDAAGYTLVAVSVGQDDIIHPSTDTHWIYEIELYANGKKVDSVSLEPVISRGYLGTRIKLDDVNELRAVAKCTLHGDWENTIKV
jgi:desulfoferrodoxin (superoxide reductase-like protein)